MNEETEKEHRKENAAIAKAHVGVLFTNIFFAGNYSVVKSISPAFIGPAALNVVRAAIAVVLFWTVWLFGKTGAGIQRRHRGRFLLCGLSGVCINQLLFIKGLTLTTTIHAALLILVTPIAVTLFALWILKERFTLAKALGMALGIGGATFLILQREASQHATNYLLGDVLIVINAIAYSIYFILVKPLMKEYSTLHVTRWVFTLGFLMLLPFGWTQTAAIRWGAFGWQQVAALLYVSVLGTFLAYFFNAYGLRKLGASVTGAYIYTQPVFAVLIAILFLNEEITWQKVLAALLIFTGVFLVNLKKKTVA
ncbi:MAG TPA: DMT family transporter [Flavisolibacter sp.]|jgi:drug/metabolite transporter (DMT)-like permease|nr:DMT family transporter [Flavisolibacter sp.]